MADQLTPLGAPPARDQLDELMDAQPNIATGAAPRDPLDEVMDGYVDGRQQQLNATAARAITVNPDKYATQKRVAKYLGYPPAAVEALPVQTEREAKLKEIQQNTAGSAALQNRFTDEDFARLAHDDTGLLSVLSNSFKRGWRGLQQLAPGMTFRADANALKNFEEVENKLASGKPVLDTEDPMALRFMTPQQRQQLKEQMLVGAGGAATSIARLETEKRAFPQPEVAGEVGRSKTFGDAVSAFLTDPVKYIAAIGPESLVQNAPGLVLGGPARKLGGVALGAATMGANSFMTDYNSSLLEGLSKAGVDITNGEALAAAAQNTKLMQQVAAQAFAHAAVVSSVDAMSAGAASKVALPGNALATRPLAREAANMLVQTPVQGAFGGVGELGGQIASGQEIDPGAILAEIVGEGFGAPGEVISMVGGHFRERAAQARATAAAEQLQEMFKTAAESKLRERSPETFQSLIQDMADESPGAPKEVRFDARQLVDTLQQAGIDETALAQLLPSVMPQLQEALAIGGEVNVPIGEFTSVVGTDLEQSLLQHARIGENELSQAESKAVGEQATQMLAEQAQRVIEQAGDSSATQVSAESVKTTVLDQLNASKRFTPDVNEAYATLVRDFYTTTAGRLGIAPDELYKRYPLSVQAEGVGALEQPAYHGTPHTVDKFTTQKIGTGEGAQAYGWGMYFAGNKEVADFYREALTTYETTIDGKPVDPKMPRFSAVMSIAAQGYDNALKQAESALASGFVMKEAGQQAIDDIKALKGAKIKQAKQKGNTYKVEIPDDADMLDYDASVKDQSPQVRAALEKVGVPLKTVMVMDPDSGLPHGEYETLDQARRAITRNNWKAEIETVDNVKPGKDVYRDLSRKLGGDEAASKALLAAGIPGLRFLDAGSRGAFAKSESRNYVIFDDSFVGTPELAQSPIVDQTETPAFKKWFGNSKVVDADGKPLVVYHGGNADIEIFNTEGRGKTSGTGAFFTDDSRVANNYPNQTSGGNVAPAFLSLKNPLIVDARGANWNDIG
jgi:hypothetical protein